MVHGQEHGFRFVPLLEQRNGQLGEVFLLAEGFHLFNSRITSNVSVLSISASWI